MITVEVSIVIEAKPEVVFDLLADHTKHPLWDPHMLEASLSTEGPIKNGAKGVTVGEFRGRRIETEIIYYAYDRPKFVSGGTTSGVVIAKDSVEFVPVEQGTRINQRIEVQWKGFMRLLEPFMKSMVRKQRKETLEALKDYITKKK